jgi:hypothetical protein
MKRKAVIRFWQSFYDEILPSAAAEIIEEEGIEYCVIKMPTNKTGITQEIERYCKNDKTNNGKPEVWSFRHKAQVTSEDGATTDTLFELTYDHMVKDKANNQMSLYFLFEPASEADAIQENQPQAESTEVAEATEEAEEAGEETEEEVPTADKVTE